MISIYLTASLGVVSISNSPAEGVASSSASHPVIVLYEHVSNLVRASAKWPVQVVVLLARVIPSPAMDAKHASGDTSDATRAFPNGRFFPSMTTSC